MEIIQKWSKSLKKAITTLGPEHQFFNVHMYVNKTLYVHPLGKKMQTEDSHEFSAAGRIFFNNDNWFLFNI
jgi:hypothetical protein